MKILLLIIYFSFISCSRPDLPSYPKSKLNSSNVNPAITTDINQRKKDCNTKGYYFNWNQDNKDGEKGTCTDKKIFLPCDINNLIKTANMKEDQITLLQDNLKGDLKDAQMDQCIGPENNEVIVEFITYLNKEKTKISITPLTIDVSQ